MVSGTGHERVGCEKLNTEDDVGPKVGDDGEEYENLLELSLDNDADLILLEMRELSSSHSWYSRLYRSTSSSRSGQTINGLSYMVSSDEKLGSIENRGVEMQLV